MQRKRCVAQLRPGFLTVAEVFYLTVTGGALFALARLFLVRSSDYCSLTELSERGMLPSQLSDMMEGGAVSLGLADTLKKMPSMPASLAAPAAQVVKKGAQIFKKKKEAQASPPQNLDQIRAGIVRRINQLTKRVATKSG